MFYSTKQPCRFSCGAIAAAVMMAAGTARAALVQPVGPTDVPVLNTASVFDSGHAGNVYQLEPGTSFIPEGFDVRDLFGGSYGTFGWEPHDVIFDNGKSAGTVDAVRVTLAAPVSLASFDLFLADDGTNGNHSASEFKLFADGQLVDDVPILNTYGNESYTGVYGSNYIHISDSLEGLPVTSDYTLELIQNQGGGGNSGVRALEFQATGGSSSVRNRRRYLRCCSAASRSAPVAGEPDSVAACSVERENADGAGTCRCMPHRYQPRHRMATRS